MASFQHRRIVMNKTFKFDRFIVAAATASLTWSTVAAAAPSQNPMLSPLPVAPNVMFTLDDSGSMLNAIMPELYTSSTSGGGVAIQVLTPIEAVAPVATVSSNNGYAYRLLPTRVPSDTSNTSTYSAYSSDAGVLLDAYRRSSRFNTIYYDPETLYKPWTKADGASMPYPAANANGQWIVPLDPVLDEGTIELTRRPGRNAGVDNDAFDVLTSTQYTNLTNSNYTNYGWCARVTNSSGQSISQFSEGSRCSTPTSNVEDLATSFHLASWYEFNAAGTQARRVSLNAAIRDTVSATNTAKATTTFTRGAGRTDCASTGGVCSWNQEMRNFATWFVYHRTRLLLAKAGVAEAFSSSALRDFRLGYGALNNPTASGGDGGSISIDGVSSVIIRAGVRDFPTMKSTFYDWLFARTAYNGTPLRRAVGAVGKYYQREDSRSPWADNPALTTSSATAASYAGCRRSFHILTTDGYWTEGDAYDADEAGARANVDGIAGPTITDTVKNRTYTYSPTADFGRYKDSRSDMLADAAMYYWNRDLAPNIPNAGFTTDQNPAWWQHMVNYTVGLGTSGNIDPAALTGTEETPPAWPTSSQSLSNPVKSDDLIHAAYNSRGRSLSAANSNAFAKALSDVLLNISDQAYPTGGVGVSGTTLTSDFAKYVPSYVAGSWKGDLKKYLVDTKNGAIRDANTATADVLDPLWSANAQMPAAAQRNIYVGKTTTSTVPFDLASLDTAMRSEMGSSPTVNDNLINYLRGDTTLDGSTFRKRASKLGDIVNSTPTYVKNTLNLQYTSLPNEASIKYNAFLKKMDSRPAMVFVGANDGMLHVFEDSTGKEIFAFIPRAVLPKLSKLSNIVYEHQLYVDGPLTETHAYVGTDWASIVLGSMGGGGKGVFAINATDASTLASSQAGGRVMWEINGSTSAAVGHIFSEVEVGPIQDGKKADGTPIYRWVAVAGNGIDSTSNTAQLLIIDIATGAIQALNTDVGSSTAPNGLGGVRTARDSNGVIQAAYAGDQQGNVWRFNLSTGSQSTWNVAFGKTPLFTAKDSASPAVVQAITAPPTVLAHPKGGTMVVIATGKLVEEADRVNAGLSQTNSIYGIWDKTSRRANATQANLIPKSNLVQQTIGGTNVGTAVGTSYFNITNNKIDWTTKSGWYMDMTLATGQRVIYPTQLVGGYVFVNSVVPASSGLCSDSSGYNGLIDALNGTVNNTYLFDTNGDGVVNTSDKLAQWYSSTSDGRERLVSGTPRQEVPPYDNDDKTKCKGYLIFSAGNDTPKCIPLGDIPGVRTWRTLPNPPRP
ncbi:MAG: hypothetical protein EOP50_01305 [Sphingobacteriales bacterium]|nr:MAG: hypothetical protein EOP50_01305 [Sphingobacteriales bacterium]